MLITLDQIADAIKMNRARFKVFFNVLNPAIQRHRLRPASLGPGNSIVQYDFDEICNVFRPLPVTFWNETVEKRLANMAELENANV